MIRRFLTAGTAALLVSACAHTGGGTVAGPDGWATLIDGARGLENWERVGDANWRAAESAIVADDGTGGLLVSTAIYADFEIRAEFWAAADTNSGILVRCADRSRIDPVSCYEVNIWDLRPDPRYGTGAIVDLAAVSVPIRNLAGGKWNTMEILARGSKLVVSLNGVRTAAIDNSRSSSGVFALQYGPGVNGARGGPIKWRKVQVRPLR